MSESNTLLQRVLLGSTLLAAVSCAPAASAPGAPAASASAAPLQVLMVGGGASHDFPRWYQQADSATLASGGFRVTYTASPDAVLPRLAQADVLYLSNNQPLPDPALRRAIFNHVSSGKGLLINHAASWYNWADWPEYNRDMIGGGTRGHRRLGEFQVNVTAPNHPIMSGVPASFTLSDELYRFMPDPAGRRITPLATATEVETGTTYPIIWIVEGTNGRVVVNTLGHDGSAHDHPAYRTILQNTVRWVSRR